MDTQKVDLPALNWLARVLDPKSSLARLEDTAKETGILEDFLETSQDMSLLKPSTAVKGISRTREYMAGTDHVDRRDSAASSSGLAMAVRDRFVDRPWTMLIVPSYEDRMLDSFLCSHDFRASLVKQMKGQNAGLILQPSDTSGGTLDLVDIFPSFLAALGEATKWPGLLVWTDRNRSVFLALPTSNTETIQSCAAWVISQLTAMSPINLQSLKTDYLRYFQTARSRYSDVLYLLQISDVHLGSRTASQRLWRLQALIEKEVGQLKLSGTVRPVITGDLLNTPGDHGLNDAESFLRFLHSLGIDDPVVVLGNHDVRRSGILSENFKAALSLPAKPVVWIPKYMVGLVCFHSIAEGKLARGYIGEKQFMKVGTQIEV